MLPGVPEAVQALRAAGFRLAVVTNQPDVARGTTTRAAVEAISRRLREELALDGVYTCFHNSADRCDCRKPKPGLLQQAARELGIDLQASAMVGDRWSDVEAGKAAGCRWNVLIRAPFSEPERTSPDATVPDLAGAAEFLLRASAEAHR